MKPFVCKWPRSLHRPEKLLQEFAPADFTEVVRPERIVAHVFAGLLERTSRLDLIYAAESPVGLEARLIPLAQNARR